MWRVMVLVYEAIHAALLPIALPDLPYVLDAFLEHIGRKNEKTTAQADRALLEGGAGGARLTPMAPPGHRLHFTKLAICFMTGDLSPILTSWLRKSTECFATQ